ncbi:hypothetical protein ACGFWE_43045 [Streptomyces sp. NPDC048523]|uniref:hypothetical protein n=1 Tax=Streptomyces sp. NPDC048523 TaxID=3365567 RepID=UPI00371CB70E
MAFRQHTKCVAPGSHLGKQYAQVVIAAAVAAGATFGAGVGFAPGVAVVALTAILIYCRWWLYDRLVCLDGGKDVCAVGLVIGVEPASEKSGLDSFDTDYSVNLMLAGTSIGDNQAAAEASFQGDLIKNQLAGVKFPINETPGFTGHSVFDADTAATIKGIIGKSDDFSDSEQKLVDQLVQQLHLPNRTAVLHVEFEGGGVYDLMLAALAALAIASVAAALCAAGIIGIVACLILSIIAAVVTAIGALVGLSDTGNPNDVNANLGELHPMRDWLVVQGSWVYDSAHDGWNEIHPIKHCQRITPETADEGGRRRWCAAISSASAAATVSAQGEATNTWQVHPSVDGCRQKTPEGPGPHIG